MLKLTSGKLVTWGKRLTSLHSYILLSAVMYTVLSSSTYQLPVYNDTPSNITVYRGARAILRCSVRNLGPKQVIWKKASSDFALTFGDMVFVDDPDISVVHVPHQEEYNLVISNVQPHDAGVYECQISTKEDLRKYVLLNVLDQTAPSSEAIKITGKSYVEKGDQIILTCNATGELYPPEDIDWFKDGSKIKPNQFKGISIAKFRIAETKTLHSQLEIDHSSMDDSGNYICRSSELAITDKSVIVLNGSAKRSRKKILYEDNAETNHSKRDNNDPAAPMSSAACTISSLYRHGRLCTCALTFLCCVLIVSNICQRHWVFGSYI
ncbi:V-set and immunoglobulin domain-containing protein 1-like isoform X2 [Mya arenaria]|uniref:V-set and immunoglobulin domain-containing protein 1-like isoform X2 n=1 Tax=Mya arenaria TaxID=6604 RepID=UPI0022E239B6|nr:V-set and immunoglobulin domain-containing protein 1-like isoform X2 [Mya arenaria]